MTAPTSRYQILISDWRLRTGRDELTTSEAAKLIGVPLRTFQRWVALYEIPHSKKRTYTGRGSQLSKCISAMDLADWLSKFHPAPIVIPTNGKTPQAEWGWQQDQKINCVTEKQ
jgi:excisionase family DNA binding protein